MEKSEQTGLSHPRGTFCEEINLLRILRQLLLPWYEYVSLIFSPATLYSNEKKPSVVIVVGVFFSLQAGSWYELFLHSHVIIIKSIICKSRLLCIRVKNQHFPFFFLLLTTCLSFVYIRHIYLYFQFCFFLFHHDAVTGIVVVIGRELVFADLLYNILISLRDE